MFGLGTLINTAGIVAGGIIGYLFGNLIKENVHDGINTVNGISIVFIGIAGAMEGMLSVDGSVINAGQSILITVSLCLGTFFGEIINIEKIFVNFGEWLKIKTGNAKDKEFVNAFVTASLTVCIGAMAIVGAIEDGIQHDWSLLATKAVLDFIIILIMTCSLGKGAIFSAIPVFIWEGLITLLAGCLAPVLNDLAMAYLSMVGSILIFCVGVNLVWKTKIRVANMLPALIFAVAAAYI